MQYIDTHTHIDGEEFKDDLDAVIVRAKAAGAIKLFIPGINSSNIETITAVVNKYPDYCYGMIGLHPEDVKADYKDVISQMKEWKKNPSFTPIAIGEIGLDYYWSREFESEQLDAFEIQVQWALEENLPLMIHCRKAQNDMVRILHQVESALLPTGKMPCKVQSEITSEVYKPVCDIPNFALCTLHSNQLRGVFHCFTGNEHEAEELLSFPGFYLGIGGVLTFKKSKLPETLPAVVPLDRIVLETDAPYMAPVPHRGERNESSFIPFIIQKLAEAYNVTPEEVADITTQNALKLFRL